MSKPKGNMASVIARFGEKVGLVQKFTITIPPANDLTRPVARKPSMGRAGNSTAKKEPIMSLDISKLGEIKGLLGACLVDSDTGLVLGTEGGAKFDLETAGAANVEVVRAKLQAIEALKLSDTIEDILITLGKQFHLVRPLEKNPNIFVYVALDKKSANLGLARLQVKAVEETLSL